MQYVFTVETEIKISLPQHFRGKFSLSFKESGNRLSDQAITQAEGFELPKTVKTVCASTALCRKRVRSTLFE